MTKLAGDASSREYFRVQNGAGKSWVLQSADTFAPDTAASHSFLSGRELLASWGVDVPSIAATAPALGWILQEDLGDIPLQDARTLPRYEKAIDWLLAWTRGEKPASTKAPHFGWAFDTEKLQFEMGFTDEHLYTQILKRPGSGYAEMAKENSEWLSARPRVYAHRDYHSRNLMVFGERLVVIDFQDARMGPLSYDLASLLWDPYVRLSEPDREKLLSRWKAGLEKISKREVRQALTDLPEEVERMKIQRLMKAIGSYASFYNRKGRRDYLTAVRPAFESVEESFARLKVLKRTTRRDEELLTLIRSIDLSVIDKLKDG